MLTNEEIKIWNDIIDDLEKHSSKSFNVASEKRRAVLLKIDPILRQALRHEIITEAINGELKKC